MFLFFLSISLSQNTLLFHGQVGFVPYGIVVDRFNNVYVSNRESNSISKISSTGTVATNFIMNLNKPRYIALDRDENSLYVSNGQSKEIRKYNLSSSSTTTFDDNSTLFVSLNFVPDGLAFGGADGRTLFVFDLNNGRIRKVNASGSLDPVYVAEDFSGARNGLCVDSNGTLYVSNSTDGTIHKIDPSKRRSTMLFASGFNQPTGLAIDCVGNVFVANYGGQRIDKITPQGNVTTDLSHSSLLNSTIGIALNRNDVLFVTSNNGDNTNGIVLKIPPLANDTRGSQLNDIDCSLYSSPLTTTTAITTTFSLSTNRTTLFFTSALNSSTRNSTTSKIRTTIAMISNSSVTVTTTNATLSDSQTFIIVAIIIGGIVIVAIILILFLWRKRQNYNGKLTKKENASVGNEANYGETSLVNGL